MGASICLPDWLWGQNDSRSGDSPYNPGKIFNFNAKIILMAKDWKDRLGVVYSTNSDFKYDKEDQNEFGTLPANQQKLIVQLDKKNRKGKAVTLVTGFTGSTEDLEVLGKLLKTKCGVGGTAKDGKILIQGDFRDKVMQILSTEGFKVKRSGG